MNAPSAATEQKAARLRREGKVHEVRNARVFLVHGDSGTYTVIVPCGDHTAVTCNCQARGHCAHMIAVNGLLLDEQEEGRGAQTPVPHDDQEEKSLARTNEA